MHLLFVTDSSAIIALIRLTLNWSPSSGIWLQAPHFDDEHIGTCTYSTEPISWMSLNTETLLDDVTDPKCSYSDTQPYSEELQYP